MVHRTQINNRIRTHELGYVSSPLGKLDKSIIWFKDMLPLQEGFYSDSQRGFSITVYRLTTVFAFEQGIVGAVSLSQSTAMATPFTRMPTINNVQADVVVKTPLFKDMSKQIKWNTHNSSVEPFAFNLKPFQVFNSDFSVESIGDSNYFSGYLPEICLNEIFFSVFEFGKFLGSLEKLKLGSSCHNPLSPGPDMPSQICLIENLALRRENADSEIFSIDVYSQNVFSRRNFLSARKISYYFQIFGQSESLANPTVTDECLESLIVSVLSNWNSDSPSRIQAEIHKEMSFGSEGFTVSWNVEFNCQTVDLDDLLLPSVSYEATPNLNIEGGPFLAQC